MTDGDANRGSQSTLVIGVGNPDRADDGIGPLVAAGLRHLPQTRVSLCSGDILALIDLWAAADAAVVIDAAHSLGAPGRVHRIDVSEADLACELSQSSTHGFGLAEAISLARALGRLPRRMVVFTVEGACFEPGAAMTREVAAARDGLRQCVSAEVERIQAGAEPRRQCV